METAIKIGRAHLDKTYSKTAVTMVYCMQLTEPTFSQHSHMLLLPYATTADGAAVLLL